MRQVVDYLSRLLNFIRISSGSHPDEECFPSRCLQTATTCFLLEHSPKNASKELQTQAIVTNQNHICTIHKWVMFTRAIPHKHQRIIVESLLERNGVEARSKKTSHTLMSEWVMLQSKVLTERATVRRQVVLQANWISWVVHEVENWENMWYND